MRLSKLLRRGKTEDLRQLLLVIKEAPLAGASLSKCRKRINRTAAQSELGKREPGKNRQKIVELSAVGEKRRAMEESAFKGKTEKLNDAIKRVGTP